MKTDLFQACGHCWVFQIFWHIECSTFAASSFRIWNNSAGIPSPPLALFVVVLRKTSLTSHSRMSGSRLVITPSWLSGSWRSLLYIIMGFPDSSVGKESACNAGEASSIPGLGRSPGEGIGYPLQYSWVSLVAQLVKNLPTTSRCGFDPWVGVILWQREWLPTPVFWPGEFHGL